MTGKSYILETVTLSPDDEGSKKRMKMRKHEIQITFSIWTLFKTHKIIINNIVLFQSPRIGFVRVSSVLMLSAGSHPDVGAG